MTALTTFRLFIAIELPSDVRRRIKECVDRLRSSFPETRASWTREENLHLTLKFLGDTPVDRVEALSQAIHLAANQIPRFEISIHGAGTFPPRGKPNVLWLGVDDPSGNLSKLYEQLEEACARASFARDERPYHAHLTIARMRSKGSAAALAQLHRDTGYNSASIDVRDLCLIKSELSSAGSRYTVLSRHALK